MLVRPSLFDATANDDKALRQLINGKHSNLFNLQEVKYSWATSLATTMRGNDWKPEEVDFSTDVQQFTKLTAEEVRAYKGILSFLIFLDSVQTNQIPNLTGWFTAPEVKACLVYQAQQELVHSNSYQYLIETGLPVEQRTGIYDYWKNDPILYNRIQVIADGFQRFWGEGSESNFYRNIICNYLLESLYFYNSFQFFYTLESRGLMIGSAEMIRFIQRDENTHVTLFERIITELGFLQKDEYKELYYDLLDQAVYLEIEWSQHILKGVLGITPKSIEDYTKFLANNRTRKLGLDPIYGEHKNPYEHLNRKDKMSNFFEGTNTDYVQATSLGGWDF